MIFRIKRFIQENFPPFIFEAVRYLYNLKYLIRLINIELNHDHRNTVIVSGTGRSGTTWIANILNFNNEYRYMFEPFNHRKIRVLKKKKKLPYMRAGKNDPDVYRLVEKILSGRIKSSWINKYNRKLIARKRLIKDIDINPVLKWIKVNFPEIPVILIMRHPFAVAYSKARLGWWDARHIIDAYLSQDDLVEDFLEGKAGISRGLKDDFSRFIFIWCIENIIPLRTLRESEVHLVFYEEFCRDPEAEIKRMFDFLGRETGREVMKTVRRPSRVTREDSAVFKGKDLVSDWKDRLTREQINSAMSILEVFGLDRIYCEDVFPDREAALRFLKSADGIKNSAREQ